MAHDHTAPQPTHGETRIAAATDVSGTQNLLEQMAHNYFAEQRRSRKWSLFFRFVRWGVIIAVLVTLFFNFSADTMQSVPTTESHIAVVEIQGVVASGGQVDAEEVIDMLDDAFNQDQAEAVVLRINSPGGSPVQAALIYDTVMSHKEITQKPVYAVIEDIGASAAYYIASSADEIYANRNSIVGSIGVILSNFGYRKLLETIGLESRTKIAGKHKDIGNPARPETPFEKQFLQNMINQMHQNFITDVKRGRGDRLTGKPSILFSGLFWTASEAKKLGLIDDIAHFQKVKDAVGVDALIYYRHESRFEELLTDVTGAIINQQYLSGVGINVR